MALIGKPALAHRTLARMNLGEARGAGEAIRDRMVEEVEDTMLVVIWKGVMVLNMWRR